MQEIWRTVPFGNWYEVSNDGRVRNTKTSKILMGTVKRNSGTTKDGYLRVCLSNDGKRWNPYVHKLVAEAFLGPCPEGLQIRHWDGNPLNNKVSNLVYGTGSENVYDAVRHGTHFQSRKTHCPKGHEYSEENTYTAPGGKYRQCKICRRASGRKSEQREERKARRRERRRHSSSPEQELPQ